MGDFVDAIEGNVEGEIQDEDVEMGHEESIALFLTIPQVPNLVWFWARATIVVPICSQYRGVYNPHERDSREKKVTHVLVSGLGRRYRNCYPGIVPRILRRRGEERQSGRKIRGVLSIVGTLAKRNEMVRKKGNTCGDVVPIFIHNRRTEKHT